MAEIGADMSSFPPPRTWLPGPRCADDARVRRHTDTSRERNGNKWLTAMLVEAAGSVGRMRGKNYLAAQPARLTRRRGPDGGNRCEGRDASRDFWARSGGLFSLVRPAGHTALSAGGGI